MSEKTKRPPKYQGTPTPYEMQVGPVLARVMVVPDVPGAANPLPDGSVHIDSDHCLLFVNPRTLAGILAKQAQAKAAH